MRRNRHDKPYKTVWSDHRGAFAHTMERAAIHAQGSADASRSAIARKHGRRQPFAGFAGRKSKRVAKPRILQRKSVNIAAQHGKRRDFAL